MGPLKRVLPRRRATTGTRPGITGEDPLSKERVCQDQWEFRNLENGLTKIERKLLLAKVMKTAVIAMFRSHTYSFGQKFFLQQVGGPIGLRSTCCIARLTMLWWDDKLLEVLEKMNIRIVAGARYMDDIRVWLRAIRLGWRVLDGILQYRDSWRLEELEMGMTALQKTTEIMRDVMNSVCGWLRLTMETEDMFDGWLPTLDLQIQMTEENKCLFL